jgi:Tol biopolymer transport system component/serine/threonine protein kinase
MPEESPPKQDCPPDTALADLVEGRLATADAARVARHVEGCSACRAWIEQKTWDTPRNMATAPTLPAQTSLDARTQPDSLGDHAEANAVGTTLDRKYRLLRVLGSGGMGQVYEAEHTGTGRRVAVKLIHGGLLARGEAGRERFRREARAVGALHTSHIVEVLDTGEDPASGDLYLVMERLRGDDLQRLIDRVGPLPPDVALRVAAQALVGLVKTHEVGIVHRDIKPANLFLARGDEGEITVKILDFGIAKVMHDALLVGNATGLTHSGGLLGSPLYMSPEQVQSSRSVDHRTDLWSLGSALYCALAGRAPFHDVESVGKLIVTICSRPPPRLRDVAPWVPPGVADVVHAALTIDADQRYPSAAAMLSAVRALLPGGSALREEMLTGVSPELRAAVHADVATTTPDPPPAPPAPSVPRSRLRWRWLAGIGVVAAIVALGAAGVVVSGRDTPPPAGDPRRITGAPGWEAEPAISPDGTLVAYVSDEKGPADLWIVSARGGDARRLTDAGAADHTPTWFPDGSALAFASDRGGHDGIWRVPREGGPATPIVADAVDPAISPDGTRIAFAHIGKGGRYALWVAPLADVGRAKALTSDTGADALWENRHPVFSPDGATIAYQDFNNLWIVPAAGGRSRRLTEGNTGDRWPSWSPDGRHLYFSSMRDGTLALWRMPTGGGPAVRLTLGTGPELEPRVSRDGERLAYSTYVEERTLVLVDVATGARARLPDVLDFALAPDGGEVVYASSQQGHDDLWVQPLERHAPRGDPRRLTELAGSLARLTFSPDGRWLAFHRVVEGQRDIWILPAKGGRLEQFTNDPAADVQPAWSPDGAFLAFVSNRSDEQQIWAAPVAEGRPAGAARQITLDATFKSGPAWSPRGDEIAYVGNAGGQNDLWIVPVTGGGAPRRITSGAQVQCARWDSRSGEIYASGSWGGRFLSVRRVSPASGESKPLDPEVSFGNVGVGRFEVSLDGNTLAVRHEEARGDIWILDAPKGSSY